MQLTPFAARVLAVVRRISRGDVLTYGQVAVRAGRPGAARSVGTILRLHGGGRAPCHRVIAANGRLGGFGGHEPAKRMLLLAEGVPMRGDRVLLPATARASPSRPKRRKAKGRYNRNQ